MGLTEFIKKELIKKKGCIPTIARLANVPPTTVHNWVQDKNIPSTDKAEKVLNALGYELKIVKKEEV